MTAEDKTAISKDFIKIFGVIGLPILAETDAEWWAITCSMLLSDGKIRGLLNAIDFALCVCSERFREVLEKGYPTQQDARFISYFVSIAETARQKNGYVQLREASEHLELINKSNPVCNFCYAIVLVDDEGVELVDDEGVQKQQIISITHPIEDESFYVGWRAIAKVVLDEISGQSDAQDAKIDV